MGSSGFTDVKRVESFIEERIKTLFLDGKEPSVIIFGRGCVNNTYPSAFDEINSMVRVFTVDFLAKNLPTLVFDFNVEAIRQKNLRYIASVTHPVLTIFDWSVFKSVIEPERFFSDVAKIQPKGSMFVFPWEARGGILTYVTKTPATAFVTDLNSISVPYPTGIEVKDEELHTKTKEAIISLSKDAILATLTGIFTHAVLIEKSQYPFFPSITGKSVFIAIV
ncbi:MAG: hypothetical protein Harvfovirus73_2 [Harvfovirus sp.]|uniref:Uncharacterized protein n=1 Tax=Harvfovirus sp. TaxID=2487768 RepID=A0A3G5A5W1_9VIRU|nr:MAG: hypothetical protein Harvfovirus73_2 [Harvfovirus sp.]